MRRKHVIIIVFAVACAFFLFLAGSGPTEPLFQGKPLSYWLKGYRAGNGRWNESSPEKADEVVGQLGTNALPTLLRMLRSTDSAWEVKLLPWSYKWRRLAGHQHLINIAPGPHLRSYEVVEAERAFRTLGSVAEPAVPELIKMYQQEELPLFNRATIPAILGDIGPSAAQSIPALLQSMRDPALRGNAAFALGQIRGDAKLVIPMLVPLLRDTNSYVCWATAKALKSYGAEAKEAVPTLLEVLNSWGSKERRATQDALRFPTNTVTLEKALNNPMVAAEEALRAIDAGAAGRAGVK